MRVLGDYHVLSEGVVRVLADVALVKMRLRLARHEVAAVFEQRVFVQRDIHIGRMQVMVDRGHIEVKLVIVHFVHAVRLATFDRLGLHGSLAHVGVSPVLDVGVRVLLVGTLVCSLHRLITFTLLCLI